MNILLDDNRIQNEGEFQQEDEFQADEMQDEGNTERLNFVLAQSQHPLTNQGIHRVKRFPRPVTIPEGKGYSF